MTSIADDYLVTTARDYQRSAVYAAENQLQTLLDRAKTGTGTVDFYGSTLTLPVERRFADLPSIQRYCDAVLSLPWVTDRWGTVPALSVRERKGQRKAHWQPPGVLAFPLVDRWALRELVVNHEIAHHLAHYAPDKSGEGHLHGPLFTAIMCDLTSVTIGPEIGLLLRSGFDGAGVEVGVSPQPKN